MLTRPPTLDDLAMCLASLIGGSAPPHEAAVLALASLDPAAVTRWLLQPASAGSSALSRPRLARVLALLAEAIGQTPGLVPPDELRAILRAYGPLLSPAHALELASTARTAALDPALEEVLHAALDRSPEHAGLLRPAADLAVAAGAHARAHDLLARLGRADPTLATMQYIHGAWSRLPRTDDPPVRIALLSSFTIDPLVPFLGLECRALRLEPHIYVAPFDTWERETLGHGSGLERFAPRIAFLAVAADDLIPELAAASTAEVAAAGEAAVERLLAAAERFTSWSSAILVVHGLHTAFRDPLGPAGARDGRARSEVMAELNARLADGLRRLPRAHWLDLPDVISRRRHGTSDNPKMRHLARMRLGEHVLGDLAREYARFIAPATGRTRKCIVLDLDNTLWGGIVGEDGPHGIRLGDTSPGSEFREFQHYLLSLTRRGLLLAVNSKNNPADALDVIRSHDAMVLREDAFSAMRINWDSKPNNVLSLAGELGIGLDSFVFVDDSEKERSLMRQALPQVLTPEMPRDPALYRQVLEDLPELQVLAITEEDRVRTRQYAERRHREQLRIASSTLDEYMASLGIEAELGPATDRTINRVHQLFQRTNQFNLTGRRYDVGTLSARAADGDWRVYAMQVSDRFGNHGLVASAVVHIEAHAWRVDNLVMSCRVIGYGVEDALLASMAADARTAGAHWLLGDFIPSNRNAPASDFYARNAFVVEDDAAPSGRWRRDLGGAELRVPAWITLRPANGA